MNRASETCENIKKGLIFVSAVSKKEKKWERTEKVLKEIMTVYVPNVA